MKKHTYFFSLILFIIHTGCLVVCAQENKDDSVLNIAYLNQLSDSIGVIYETKANEALIKHDTSTAIENLVAQSIFYSHKTNFGKSYDAIWKALIIADASENNDNKKGAIYNQLAWTYSLFKRYKRAIEYFNKCIEYDKKYLKPNVDSNFIRGYFGLLSLYRKTKNNEMARIYADSCRQFAVKNDASLDYINSEIGFILHNEGKNDLAIKKINQIRPHFETYFPSYLVIIYSQLGSIYSEQESYDSAIKYYQKALDIAQETNKHLDLVPDIYASIAAVYHASNKNEDAYNFLKKAKELDGLYFGSRSSNLKEFFEIKDVYRLEKHKQQEKAKNAQLLQLEREKENEFLKSSLLIIALLFTSTLAIIIYKHTKQRHKVEKQKLKIAQELELKKQAEILALKNKELMKYSLQEIEKKEQITELKKKLLAVYKKGGSPDLSKIINSLDIDNSSHWSEFEARFLSINDDFYEKLNQKFPKLSQSDHKICALIKLNFDSKEMSRLLGISTESVHTTRYRLRKKLGLVKGENLGEFINKI